MPKKERTTIFANHNKRGYVKWGNDFRQGSKWRKVRNVHFQNHPFCEVYDSIQKTVDGHEVDHLIPPRFGGAKFHPGNLATLNKPLHDRKTSEENRAKKPLFPTRKTPHGLIPKSKKQAIEYLTKFCE